MDGLFNIHKMRIRKIVLAGSELKYFLKIRLRNGFLCLQRIYKINKVGKNETENPLIRDR